MNDTAKQTIGEEIIEGLTELSEHIGEELLRRYANAVVETLEYPPIDVTKSIDELLVPDCHKSIVMGKPDFRL